MGIYIKGMEMPTKCADCEVLSDDLVCPFTGLRGYNGKPKICPLVEIPPQADVVERKKGEWLDTWHELWKTELPVCSYCGSFAISHSDFCPNCGAEMRKGGES